MPSGGARRRRPPWRTLSRRTLRGRLIAGLVALLAIACAAVGGTAYFAVRSSASDSLNSQLQTASQRWSYCMAQQSPQDQDSGPPGKPAPRHPATDADSWDGQGPPGSSGGCLGLAPNTFDVRLEHGVPTSAGIVKITPRGTAGTSTVNLSPADVATLDHLPAGPSPPPGAWLPTHVETLPSAGGTYLLTAFKGNDGDVLITGLPTSSMDSLLSAVEVKESIVFAAVLLLAGVLGTLWVGLSLRPLKRVAATAAQVAELPLESGEVELPAGVPDTDPRTEAGQMGTSFNRMLGHVQAALARRAASEARLRRFAADASHELRTPLSAIRGYSELALRHPGPVPVEITHALRRVESESARMSVLVDDLLLLARLDAGRPLAREPVDLSRLAIDVTSDARVARPDHRWVLDLPDDPVQVIGDNLRLHQVLANLLSNAGRHTPPGSTVAVRVSLNPGTAVAGAARVRRGDLPPPPVVELSVTDDGPGIPPELLPELFERFTRADTARTHADGSSTGLGLAIVDAVVAAHHGCITVTSRPGMTQFGIALTGLPADAPPAGLASARHRGTRRILHRE